jgi:hypothetical protein
MISVLTCDPDRIRTCDPQLRRLLLYPAELLDPLIVVLIAFCKSAAKVEYFSRNCNSFYKKQKTEPIIGGKSLILQAKKSIGLNESIEVWRNIRRFCRKYS